MPKKRVLAEDDSPIALAIPLPTEGIGTDGYWADEIEQAEARLKKYIKGWQQNLNAYRGERPRLIGIHQNEVIAVPLDFTNTEQKKAQLFYQTPEVQVSPRQPGLEQPAVVFGHVLNEFLGPHEIDAKTLVDQVLMDVLCPAGIGVTKIGYENRTQDVPQPVLGPPDPITQQPTPVIDPTTGQPAMQIVKQVLWSRYYWDRISPVDYILPASFTGSRYEDAPYQGFRFRMDVDRIATQFRAKRDGLSDAARFREESLCPELDRDFLRASGTGYEIWYKAALYDPTVLHPDHLRRLVIVEQTKKRRTVVIHENSPYQTFTPDGQLDSQNPGMIGFPIHVLSTREVSDTALPPSDCTISRPQVDELSMGRSQMILQRRRNLPLRWFDQNRLTKDQISRIERGDIQGLIPLDGNGTEQIGQVAPAQFPRENFTFNDYVQQDVDKTWALGANQQGVKEEQTRTATELTIIQQATDTRMSAERERVLSWYVKGAEKLAALIQLFADDPQIVQIVGPDGAQQLQAWDRKKIQGRYAFSLKPDSSVRINAAEERDVFLRAYNLLANDPNVNRVELVKMLASKFHLDPSRLIQPPPPPPPEKPKVNFSFKGEDLANPVVLEILEQTGIRVSPEAIQNMMLATQHGLLNRTPMKPNAQTAHGGAAQTTEPISQHDANLTGRLPGPGPM